MTEAGGNENINNMTFMQKFEKGIKSMGNIVLNTLKLRPYINDIIEEHPESEFFIIIFTLILLLPLGGFLVFAVGSFFFLFMVFLITEGIVLSFGLFILIVTFTSSLCMCLILLVFYLLIYGIFVDNSVISNVYTTIARKISSWVQYEHEE